MHRVHNFGASELDLHNLIFLYCFLLASKNLLYYKG